MKILMVGPLPPPVGGMATVVENLVGALGGYCDIRVLNNAKTTPADRAFFQGATAQLRLLGKLAGLCLFWRPRVVHIHTCSWFTFWRNGLDVLLSRLLGRRVIVHIHGGQFQKFLASLSSNRLRLARGVFRLADRVLVLGVGWKRLLDSFCDPARVVIVPNGVPVQAPVDNRSDDAFTILCLASYERLKGQRDLVQAVSALHCGVPVRVVFLGVESDPDVKAELKTLVDSLGLAEQVDILGPVMGEAKWEYFRRAACFCLPSYDEGLPMAILEAMGVGLPVVVTRVGAVPEAVADGKEGLIYDAGDVAALAHCLQTLIDDPERAQRIGAAGRERLICEFSLDRSAGLLRKIYDDL